MKLFKFGITLKRITPDDIELVRQWRNSEEIRQYMHFRDYITKEMQLDWFRSINNIYNFYYIIQYKGDNIGLFNEKNVDWKNRTSETGLFIADERYLNTQIPILVSLFQSEIGFYLLKGEKSYIRIMKDNVRAVKYSQSFGYELCENQENEDLQLYMLTKERYEEKGKKLLDAANKVYKNEAVLRMYMEKHDYESGFARFFEDKIKELNVNIPYDMVDGVKVYHYP